MSRPMEIVHVIQELTLGGACRAMMTLAKYTTRLGNCKHYALGLLPLAHHSPVRELAAQNSIQIIDYHNAEHLHAVLAQADIVQLQWWNNPHMDSFLRGTLPAMRLLGWMHVGGAVAPQIITSGLVEMLDFSVACSPYTYESHAFQQLSPQTRSSKTGMAYGAADFERLTQVDRKPHAGFNVGYIGTLDYCKMHPRYFDMSTALDIPNVRFILAGGGSAVTDIQAQAEKHGIQEKFSFRGNVEDVASVIQEFDVYGYPLCPETYAASEMNLQEIMFAGVPAVVFPYGGIKRLVVDGVTALVVNSEKEYKEAIEYLYNNPDERKRIGENAHHYAKRVFHPARAAEQFMIYYENCMRKEKRERTWPTSESIRVIEQHILGGGGIDPQRISGSLRFIESIEGGAQAFLTSMTGAEVAQVIRAEKEIAQSHSVLRVSGITQYSRYYPQDAYLRLWYGLTLLHTGEYTRAQEELFDAMQFGLQHWRVLYYFYKACERGNNVEVAAKVREGLFSAEPQCEAIMQTAYTS